jgi:hypothetical protein
MQLISCLDLLSLLEVWLTLLNGQQEGFFFADEILDEIRHSPVVGSDETGARVDGKNQWQWVFVTEKATYHVIAPSRGSGVIENGRSPTCGLGERLVECSVQRTWQVSSALCPSIAGFAVCSG